MAYKGQEAIAYTINALNAKPSFSINMHDGSSIQDELGNSGIIYSHRPSGSVLVRIARYSSGNMTAKVFRFFDDSWSLVDEVSLYNVSEAVIRSQGPSKYMVVGSSETNGICEIYCGQSDCEKGEKIICWDDFKSSLNKVNTGEPITAKLANEQRIGCI